MASKTIILVTGGNSGIGYETVALLSKESADYHVLMGSRSVEKGQKALEDMKSAHGDSLKGTISVVQIDVSDEKSILALKDHIETQFGKLDVLINNAGIIVYQQMSLLEQLRKTFETNVFGTMLLSETLEPLLQKSSKPYLIYVSSGQGSITQKLLPDYEAAKLRADPYRMSKAALNMLSATHRRHWSEWGCRVLAFDPGFCVSNLTGAKGREMRKSLGARDPSQPAATLVDVVGGGKDAFFEKSGMLDVDGALVPW
ncbi:hypothetical protein M406DRAFT_70969 [Cryphonectria parasitica EP155]|uniref:Short chain dehydrogenase n=1 Tax=Cryphonectria parasitica (strain ATCC 38755 / EP155) TaxID=660469 RepID=A0A9P5CMU7_CRYP1|nr:uncharacterized protein M406DRAFT_70969 [Cryphonectria parasitica EP155]KAF3764493.1 hypothetical protein M406DRAFT_70969 [Cryphonectria parasitica EP155]